MGNSFTIQLPPEYSLAISIRLLTCTMKDEWKASNGDTCATNDCVILMTGGFRAWVFYSLSFNPANHSR